MTRIALICLPFAMGAAIAMSSCNKDKDDDPQPCSANFNIYTELSQESTRLQAAAEAYGMDQSQPNCLEYVDAWNDYLDAARDLESCAVLAGQQAEYNQAIDEAQTAIDQIQC